ncbi:MAG: 50S ribosomal protein L21 [Spirochaetota bacterium]
MYAMVEIKGNQYKAEKGDLLTVQRVASEKGDVVEFDNVLMLRDESNVKIGEPYVSGAKVKAVVEDHVRGDKVIVHKYKRRKRYKRTRGHRQDYTLLRVEEIIGS